MSNNNTAAVSNTEKIMSGDTALNFFLGSENSPPGQHEQALANETQARLKETINELLSRFATLIEKYLSTLFPITDNNSISQIENQENQKLLGELIEVDKKLGRRLSQIEKLYNLSLKVQRYDELITEHQEFLKQTPLSFFKLEDELQDFLFQLSIKYKEELSLGSSSEALDPTAVLNYSQTIKATTFAPVNYDQKLFKKLYKPPAPQEDMMRASFLYQGDKVLELLQQKSGSDLASVDVSQQNNANTIRYDKQRASKEQSELPQTKEEPPSDDWLDLDLNPDLSY